MKGKVVAFLESRMADQMSGLVTRRGGIPMSAPALTEEPDLDPVVIRTLVVDWTARSISLAIFQIGVGTRALFAATDALGLTSRFLELLEHARVAARGPKPTAVLRGRGVRIDYSAEEPFTTTQLLQAINTVALTDAGVLVQRYGDANPTLDDALVARGARVIEVPTYRWALPADIQPLLQLIDALEGRRVDAVVFTSASQVHNLFLVAARGGKTRTPAQQSERHVRGIDWPGLQRGARGLRRHGEDRSTSAQTGSVDGAAGRSAAMTLPA